MRGTKASVRSTIVTIQSAENLSSIDDDVAVECSTLKLSNDAATSTYNYCNVAIKLLPVAYVAIALWGIYLEVYRVSTRGCAS